MRHFRGIVFFVAILIGASAQAGVPLLVGIMERPQCQEGKPDVKTSVRVLFARQGREWVALRSTEAARGIDFSALTWTVAFDGRSLGLLRTTDPGFHSSYAWTYPRDRLLDIREGQSVPAVTNTAKRYSGWCDVPSDQPLVVVSQPNFRDPAGWRQFPVQPDYRKTLFEIFRATAGAAFVCPEEADSHDKPFKYGINDLVIHDGYKDRFGRKLIALGLNPKANTCDGPTEKAWWWHWFLVEPETRFVGSGLEFVAAGDYDADGKPEFIFWYSGYNEDGYTLYYDGFRKRVDYYWNYH